MSDRPKIPNKVILRVLIESGHRCAVDGTPTSLEQVHIIPWRKSKEHRAEDLICLCASCHARADKEKWGEKTLREYKKNPWIMRRYKKSYDIPRSSTKAILTIDMELEQFDEKNQRWLQMAVAAFLDISPHAIQIRPLKFRRAEPEAKWVQAVDTIKEIIRERDPCELERLESTLYALLIQKEEVLAEIALDPSELINVRAMAARLFFAKVAPLRKDTPGGQVKVAGYADQLRKHERPLIRLAVVLGLGDADDRNMLQSFLDDPHPAVVEEAQDLLEEAEADVD